MVAKLAPYSKAVSAGLGALAIIITSATGLPAWVPSAFSVITMAAVFLVPNVTPPGKVPPKA